MRKDSPLIKKNKHLTNYKYSVHSIIKCSQIFIKYYIARSQLEMLFCKIKKNITLDADVTCYVYLCAYILRVSIIIKLKSACKIVIITFNVCTDFFPIFSIKVFLIILLNYSSAPVLRA